MKLTETDKRQIAKNLVEIKECVIAKYICDYCAYIDMKKTAAQEACVSFKWGCNNTGFLTVRYNEKENTVTADLCMVCGYVAKHVELYNEDQLVKDLSNTDGWYFAFALLKNWNSEQNIKPSFSLELTKLKAIYRTIYDFKATEG